MLNSVGAPRSHAYWVGVRAALIAGILASLLRPAGAAEPRLTLTLSAPHHAYHNTPVTVVVPSAMEKRGRLQPSGGLYLRSADGKEMLRCQVTRVGKEDGLVFLLPDLPQGAKRVYHLQEKAGSRPPSTGVWVKPHGDDLDIFVGTADKDLFTRYTTHSGPNKPFFYPILTPDGQPMTRRWPVEPDADHGESHDHPHHRGLWFTHSRVNGVDFWTEQGEKVGKTINKAFADLESGPVCGAFRARTEWRMPDDKLIATDTRDVRVYTLPNGDRVLDFEVTLTPVGGPLVFGDNKDGMFGLRVPDTMALKPDKSSKIPGQGHIVTSVGNNDEAAWGKAADWVDYWGPIHGQTYGVAIFDNPANLRHPETWHARDYGLFCANPFGLHDFKLGPEHAGDYTVPQDKTLTFRYRVLFHKGDTTSAAVASQYAAYTDPPKVEVQ